MKDYNSSSPATYCAESNNIKDYPMSMDSNCSKSSDPINDELV